MKKKSSSKPGQVSHDCYVCERGDKSKPALLFLHGFMGMCEDWFEVVEKLDSNYYCIIPDLPGHGRSGYPVKKDAMTIESVSQDIVNLLKRLKVDQVTVIGYSMGGRIGLNMALQFPQMLSGLILEGAGAGLEDEYERHVRAALDDDRAYQLRVLGIDAFFDDWYKTPLFESLRKYPQKIAKLRLSRAAHNAEGLAEALQGLSPGRQTPLWNRLGELKIPSLLICGALDHTYTRINRSMSEKMPFCELKIIGDAGHNTHLEQPEAFVTTIERFLSEYILKTK